MEHALVDLIEKERVLAVVKTLFISTDRKDWNAVLHCFADKVLFDMSSMTGGPSQVVAPETIVEGWSEGLNNIPAVHHQIGNEIMTATGDLAHVFCYGIALHHSPGPRQGKTRRFVGSYDMDLSKQGGNWKIAAFKYDLKFIDGDMDLP